MIKFELLSKKKWNCGKLHLELDHFQIPADFLMKLVILLKNVMHLMLYNEMNQHLEDLFNSANVSKWSMYDA